jgi:hypothetical protein
VDAVAGQSERLARAAADGRERCERGWAEYLNQSTPTPAGHQRR